LNGGLSKLISRLPWVLVGCMTQIAFGAWACTSFTSSGGSSPVKVMSNLPDTNARIEVERLGMMVNSMPSRYGLPGFQ
jgi:hypothetical protein